MVSVIIPTYNAMPGIDRLLHSLKRQSVECEIIVIDSSSRDDTAQVAKSCGARVVVIPKESFNHGGTRNFAVAQSTEDVVVFLTQDVLPFDEWCIERLIKPLEDPLIAASYGRQIPREDAMPTEKFARCFNYPASPSARTWDDVAELGIKAFFFSNACSAVRRKEFEDLGGFPEKVIMFEDMLYAARLLKTGYVVAYTPDAMVIHSHDYGFRAQFLRHAKAGLSFSSDPWFMENARSRGQGVNLLREEMTYLFNSREYYWCLYALTEAIFKYAGYRLGLKHGRFLSFAAKSLGVSLSD
jgi:rhamnosyltransferase